MDGSLDWMIARHVAGFPTADVPDSTLHAAARSLLDGVGVMIAASGASDDVRPYLDLAAAGGTGPASVLGTGARATPALAALANGAMAHALDFEDAFDPAPSHPNASLLPAAIALADADPTISGRELLAAIAIGCDLVCRLGLGLTRPMEDSGWYPPPILGALGAAAAAARLRRLDARGVLDTLSLTLCQISVPGEIKYAPQSVIRAVREAFPAQAAVQASALAAAGVRGFDRPMTGTAGFFRLFALDHYDAGVVQAELGARWWVEALTYKKWPACRGTHAYIEAAQALRAAYGFAASDIDAIIAWGGAVQRMLVEPLASKQAPTNAIDAKFSIPYTVAAALLDREVTLDSFHADRLADPDRRALAGRVQFAERADWGRDRAASGILEVRLRDGSAYRHVVALAIGTPENPLDDATLTAKFVDCAGRARLPLSPAAAAGLAEALLGIADTRSATCAFDALL